jgi:hypothetical protein
MTEKAALDVLLGRELHKAFLKQLSAPIVPVEMSPTGVLSVAAIVGAASIGSVVGGDGGLFRTAAGGLLAIMLNTTVNPIVQELTTPFRRRIRKRDEVGSIENDNELLTLQVANLRLRKERQALERELTDLSVKRQPTEGKARALGDIDATDESKVARIPAGDRDDA